MIGLPPLPSLHAVEWLSPHALWLGVPWVLGTLLAWRRRPPAPAAPWLPLFAEVDLPRSWRTRCAAWPRWCERFALLCVLLAAARPVTRNELASPIAGIDLALCVDRSSSMTATDAGDGRTRLAAAQAALAAVVARRPEDRIALVPFARWPDVGSPLTRDHLAVGEALAAITAVAPDSGEDATGIGTALARAAALLAGSDAPSRVIVLLTDGEENVASAEAQDEIAPLHAAQWCAAQGIRLHVIVTGGEAQDTRQVEAAAQATGGRFFRAPNGAAVAEVCATLDALEQALRRASEWRYEERSGALLLAGLLALLLAALLVLLGAAVEARRWREARSALALRAGVVALLGFALTAPTRGREASGARQRGDFVFALDVSRSMLAGDVAASRLEAARAELVELARASAGERFGLVAFAGAAVRVVPLTADTAAFAELAATVEPATVARGGSDLAAALRLAEQALAAADSADGSIVLLTDGEDLAGQAAALAPELRTRGIVVHALGYGSPLGSRIALAAAEGGGFAVDRAGQPIVTRLDERALQTLCTATGGRYVAVRDHAAPLAEWWQELPADRPPRSAERAQPRPLAPWLAAAAFLLGVGASWLARRARRAAPPFAAGWLLVAAACSEPPSDRATPAWNEALAARAAGVHAAAVRDRERAAAWAPERFEAAAAFLRGLDAWEAQATGGGAAAIAGCREALAEWQFAAGIEPGWPELRRNCERALLRLAALERDLPRKEGVADERRSVAASSPPAPPLPPPPEPPAAAADPGGAALLTPQLERLGADEVQRIAERLREKEAAKRTERSKARRAASADVERDW